MNIVASIPYETLDCKDREYDYYEVAEEEALIRLRDADAQSESTTDDDQPTSGFN